MMTLKTERQCEKKSVKGRFEQTENWTILKPAVFTPVRNLSIQKPQDVHLGLSFPSNARLWNIIHSPVHETIPLTASKQQLWGWKILLFFSWFTVDGVRLAMVPFRFQIS